MKTALKDATEKLYKELVFMKREKDQIAVVPLYKAEEILQEFEVALLNEIDEKRIKETKTSY